MTITTISEAKFETKMVEKRVLVEPEKLGYICDFCGTVNDSSINTLFMVSHGRLENFPVDKLKRVDFDSPECAGKFLALFTDTVFTFNISGRISSTDFMAMSHAYRKQVRINRENGVEYWITDLWDEYGVKPYPELLKLREAEP